ncbi:uncharacterized protein Z518_06513 [Rhinocladiella mackenziei CBS 650.93]|uniref:Xylanolytic transcriptional activator regulatory domain-containing protein n=1 Tax=Rhinocladiella mackenziei CBS 650.93 TaxID=1442369 RepID=A0A0D2GXR9_9EURO|nr:uncharacterized protein Z518_06513 [Rhinocladiella mackenziei CBS 650.93]KIX02963.1 hypothetical protein Z518_06513 [Rhinocladiella mackenziei CBS 650.93]
MSPKSIAPIEIGSFTASNPQKTEFIGSSSGVFFVSTVFRAFARSAYKSKISATNNTNEDQSRQNDPDSIDSRLVDLETPNQLDDEGAGMRVYIEHDTTGSSSSRSYGVRGHGLGVAPDLESARELLMLYFRNWHPLFPFLHGPTLLETILGLYEDGRGTGPGVSLRSRLCQVIICQCIFNIAALDWGGRSLPVESQVESPTKLLSLAGYVASNHDTHSIQALLAAELYLVSTMSLRAASTIGGTLSRVMFHAGLHRCPFRYPQIPPPECDLRKRIFWSAYVLDRYLSQALGHPLGIQDSDLDVCIPGMDELHKPVKGCQQHSTTLPRSDEEVLAHLPRGHPGQTTRPEVTPTSTSADKADTSFAPASMERGDVEARGTSKGSEILGHYVLYCRLTGQAVEMFHKSLQNRSIHTEDTVELQLNVHAWWNGLPRNLQDEYTGGKLELSSTFTFFFITMYNYLLLLINRPFLSLPPQSQEFRSSLQTCVTASRHIITTSRHQSEWKLAVSWPGMLSVTWMAGLVLSFACTWKQYPFSKAQREIEDCIQQMAAMDKSWNNARHCSEALRSLLENLKIQYDECSRGKSTMPTSRSANVGILSTPTESGTSITSANPLREGDDASRKRRKTGPQEKRVSRSTIEPGNSSADALLPDQAAEPAMNQDFIARMCDMGDSTGFGNASMLPILEYTGPDFGFSSGGQFVNIDAVRLPVAQDWYASNNGAFGNIGWETMAYGSGSLMHDSSAWGPTRL